MTRQLRHRYRDRIFDIVDSVLAGQGAAIDAARDAVVAAIASGGIVHVAGSGHSHMLAEEVFYRAGGIAAAQAILDDDLMLHRGAQRSTQIEREDGQAARVISRYDVGPDDVVFVASNSGRNAYPIEMALLAREKGATTVAITSLDHARQVQSRHVSGKRLFEIADIVLDNGGVLGDGALDVAGLDERMGPTSTIIGVYLLNAIIAEAVEMLLARGIPVDVYRSANRDGAEDASRAILDRWRDRIVGL